MDLDKAGVAAVTLGRYVILRSLCVCVNCSFLPRKPASALKRQPQYERTYFQQVLSCVARRTSNYIHRSIFVRHPKWNVIVQYLSGNVLVAVALRGN